MNTEIIPPPDPRLIEAVAAALCWAEFGATGHTRRQDDPASYWNGILETAKDGYRKSAVPLAMFMRGSDKLAIVPQELSPEMLKSIRGCIRASEFNIRQAWSLMLDEAWLAIGKLVRGRK